MTLKNWRKVKTAMGLTYVNSSYAMVSTYEVRGKGWTVYTPKAKYRDLSKAKAQLTDMGALKTSLQLERDTRANQFGTASQQILVNVENIYGTDPDEISNSLTDTLKDKISI